MAFLEILKVIFLGIVEGVTEWLPISSTGHMLLVDEFLHLKADQDFKDMFFVVIQLGAILAVIVMYWNKLWPFAGTSSLNRAFTSAGKKSGGTAKQRNLPKKYRYWKEKNTIQKGNISINRSILRLWLKVIIATIPAGVFGLLLDDWADQHMHTPVVIAAALIIYGAAFILIENWNRKPDVTKLSAMTLLNALKMGLFQVLAIIPGTSRSGSTIIGGLLTGVSRSVAAEFSFFMSIPVMFGWSLVKLIKFGLHYTAFEAFEMILGMVVAFVVSVFVIRFLMNYIRKHDFKAFGYYRIALGVLVLLIFGIKAAVK